MTALKIIIRHKETQKNVFEFVYFRHPDCDMIVELGNGKGCDELKYVFEKTIPAVPVDRITVDVKDFEFSLRNFGFFEREVNKMENSTIFNFRNEIPTGKMNLTSIKPNSRSPFFTERIRAYFRKNATSPFEMKSEPMSIINVGDFSGMNKDEFDSLLKDLKMMSDLDLKTSIDYFHEIFILRAYDDRIICTNEGTYTQERDGTFYFYYIKKHDVSSSEIESSLERLRSFGGFADGEDLVKRGYSLILKERSNDGKIGNEN